MPVESSDLCAREHRRPACRITALRSARACGETGLPYVRDSLAVRDSSVPLASGVVLRAFPDQIVQPAASKPEPLRHRGMLCPPPTMKMSVPYAARASRRDSISFVSDGIKSGEDERDDPRPHLADCSSLNRTWSNCWTGCPVHFLFSCNDRNLNDRH